MKNKRAVIVVHGVGDQDPGATVNEFAHSYVHETGGWVRGKQEVWWLEDPNPRSKRKIELFPSHVLRADQNGDELVFVEVFWADLSRLTPGIVGALQGIFTILLGLEHVIKQALPLKQLKKWSKRFVFCVRRASSVISYLIRGPVIVINVMLALSVTVVLLFYTIPNIGLILVVGGVSFMAGWGGERVGEQRGWENTTAKWVKWGGVGILPVILIPWVGWYDSHNRWWFFELLIDLLNATWIVIGVAFFMLFILYPLTRISLKCSGSNNHVAGLNLAYFSTAFSAGLWAIMYSIAWVMVFHNFSDKLGDANTKNLLMQGFQWVGVIWINLLIILIAGFIFAWSARNHWNEKNTHTKSYDNSNPPPRLILAEWVIRLAGFSYILWIAGFSYIMWMTFFCSENIGLKEIIERQNCGLSNLAWIISSLQDNANALVITLVLVTASLFRFFLKYIQVGIDIALDVISHFHPKNQVPPIQSSIFGECHWQLIKHYVERIFSQKRSGAVSEDAKATIEGKPFSPRVTRMTVRIEKVALELWQRERPNRVTIVAHSQGTIAALSALMHPTFPGNGDNCLITMGSPLTHIYQEYFSEEFPVQFPLDKIQRIKKWVNIFRKDDFVGTHINEVTPGIPHHSEAVDQEGHTGYWSDPQVLKKIKKCASL